MNQPGEWAGKAEIEALCLHLNIKIVVRSTHYPAPQIFNVKCQSEHTINLIHTGGNHYQSLIKPAPDNSRPTI